MAYPTLQEIRQANASVNDDGYLLLTLTRPAGPYLAWTAMRLGATPRQINYLSLVLGLCILVLAGSGDRAVLIAATALLFVWQMVDVSDGTMARALGIRDNFGGFVDYATGMVVAGFLPFCLAIGAYHAPDHSAAALFERLSLDLKDPSITVLIAGAGISVIALFMRLINRVLFIRFGDSFSHAGQADDAPRADGLAHLLAKNVETLGGIQAFAYFAAAVGGLLDALLVLYFILYCVFLAAFTVSTYRNYGHRTAYLG